MFLSISEGEGNGGAFKAMLAITLLIFGGGTSSIIETSELLISFFRKRESVGFLSSRWMPLMLCSPPILFYTWVFLMDRLVG